jgi:hypothetical protein
VPRQEKTTGPFLFCVRLGELDLPAGAGGERIVFLKKSIEISWIKFSKD